VSKHRYVLADADTGEHLYSDDDFDDALHAACDPTLWWEYDEDDDDFEWPDVVVWDEQSELAYEPLLHQWYWFDAFSGRLRLYLAGGETLWQRSG